LSKRGSSAGVADSRFHKRCYDFPRRNFALNSQNFADGHRPPLQKKTGEPFPVRLLDLKFQI
jgi:hypothetical protein